MNQAQPRFRIGARPAIHWGLAVSTVLASSAFSLRFASPNEFKWEFLVLCNICVLLDVAAGSRDGMHLSLDRLDLFLLAFLGLAGLSVSWSPDPASAALASLKWLLLAVPFLYLKYRATPQLNRFLLRAIALGNGIVLAFSIAGGANWAGFGNENFLAEFQLISLPFLIALLRVERAVLFRTLVSALISLEVVDLVVFNPSRMEWLIAVGGLTLGVEIMLWRRLRRWPFLALNLLFLALSLAGVAWLWLHAEAAEAFFRESMRPRFALMLNTLRMWLDAPLLGHGAGSFDALYPLYKEWHLQYFEHADKLLVNKMVKAGAAHNEVLQFLAEYGVVGLGLLAGVSWQLARRWLASPRGDVYAVAGLGVLLTGLAIGMIEFPLQNPATALLLVLGAGMLASRCGERPLAQWTAGRYVPATCALVAACVLAAAVFRFDQSNQRFGQVSGLLGTDPKAAFEANAEAFRLNPWDRRIRMQLYTTLTFWAENSPEPVSSPEENDRTYALSSRGAENQPVLLLARVQHLLNSGRHEVRREETEALLEELKRHSSRMADVWILEAYYALLLEERERAANALRRAQSLDPSPEQRENLSRLRENL